MKTMYHFDTNMLWDTTLQSFGKSKGYEPVHAVGVNANDKILFEISVDDEKEYSHIQLKKGEKLYRYVNHTVMNHGWLPLIKFNLERGRLYYMTQESFNGDTEEVVFETRGVKQAYVRSMI